MLLRHLHRRIGVSSLPLNGSPGAKVQTIPISASRVSILHTRSISSSSHRNGYPSSTNVPISALISSDTYSRPAIYTGRPQSLDGRRHYAQEALKSQVEEDEPQVSPESSPIQTWKHYAPRVYVKTTKAPSSRIVARSMIPDSKPVTGKLEKVEGQEVRDDDKALQKNGKGVAAGDRNRVRSTDHHGTSTDARSTVNKSSVSNPRSTEKLVPEATNRRSRSTSNPAALRNRGSSDGHPHLDDIHEMEQLAFDPQDHQVRRGRSRDVENDRQARMEDKKAPRDFGDGIGDAATWRGKGGSADRDPVKKTRLTVKKPASVSSRGNLLPDNRSPNSVSRNPTKSARRGRSVQDMRAVPGNIDADDIGEVEDISHEHVQLGLGLALTTSPSDAYIDAPTDHPLGDDFDEINQADLMRHLQGVEEYAPEQNESLKKGLKDVRGRSAWGTKENPLKGDLDPLEVDVMGIDKLAGGEEQLSLFTDQELEALMSAARERGEHVVESDGADLPRTSKRARFKSRSATMETASLPLSVKAARFPPSALLDENSGARYGMDGNGNPTPSRFQWWERATSRHAASLYHAKKVMVRRRSLPVQRMTSKDYWFRPLKSYTDNFVPLIEAEQAHEERLIRERLDSNGAEKLVMEGYCLNELSARRDAGTQAGRPTYTFSFAGHGTRRFAWNRFNPGTCVIISPSGERANPVKKNQSKGGTGSNTYNTGSVVSKTHGSVKVSFDEPLNAAGLAQTWRLDIWTSDIVMRRAKEALATLHYDPVEIDQYGVYKPPKRGPPTEEQAEAVSNQELEEKPAPKPTVNQLILPGTALRRVLLDDFILHDPSVPRPARLDGPGFFADNELIQTWCRRQLVEGREPIEVEGDPEMTLNTSQRRAIATMLSSNMSLIQGPPGTGKTRTIIEMLRLLKVHWEVPQPILVSAYTNNAVDNLAEERLTLDWYLEQHPDKDELRRLKGLTYNLAKDDPRREGYRSRLFGLERRMVTDILLGVDVVCATCISSRGRLLEVVDFPVVFIDEASMATEPNAVIPLTKGCQHAALIGDHKQLPPLVISAKAAEGKLQTSLFERLINSGKIPSVMLDTQYRMHPSISAFPSKAFYGSKLKDGTIDKEGKVLPGLEPPQGLVFKNDVTGQQRTVTFIHHTKPDFARAKSIVNEGEAKIVYKVVLQLLKENPQLMGSDIGIIAPYAGQISRIENEIRHNTRRRLQSLEYLGEERSWELDRIEVHTVDGFEGREKRVILFSTTRSNEGNWIGFLDDWRRMNVGLTRAKSGLIIVGNSHTLENARSNLTTDLEATAGTVYWRQLIRDLREANAIESYDIENVVSTSLGKDDAAVEIDMQEVEEREQEAGSVREKM